MSDLRKPFIKSVGILISRSQTSLHAKAIFKKTIEYHIEKVFKDLHLPSDRRCDVTTVGTMNTDGTLKVHVTLHLFSTDGTELPRLIFEKMYKNDRDLSNNLFTDLTDMVLKYLSKALYNRSGKVIEYKRGMSSWIPPTTSIKTHRNQTPTAQTVTLDPNGITISHANVSTVINGDGILFFSKD